MNSFLWQIWMWNPFNILIYICVWRIVERIKSALIWNLPFLYSNSGCSGRPQETAVWPQQAQGAQLWTEASLHSPDQTTCQCVDLWRGHGNPGSHVPVFQGTQAGSGGQHQRCAHSRHWLVEMLCIEKSLRIIIRDYHDYVMVKPVSSDIYMI